jgi:hypothetical protein
LQARTAPGELHNAGVAHIASSIEAQRFQLVARGDCCEGGIRKQRRDERECRQIWRSICDTGDVVIGEQQPESQVTQTPEWASSMVTVFTGIWFSSNDPPSVSP